MELGEAEEEAPAQKAEAGVQGRPGPRASRHEHESRSEGGTEVEFNTRSP